MLHNITASPLGLSVEGESVSASVVEWRWSGWRGRQALGVYTTGRKMHLPLGPSHQSWLPRLRGCLGAAAYSLLFVVN